MCGVWYGVVSCGVLCCGVEVWFGLVWFGVGGTAVCRPSLGWWFFAPAFICLVLLSLHLCGGAMCVTFMAVTRITFRTNIVTRPEEFACGIVDVSL